MQHRTFDKMIPMAALVLSVAFLAVACGRASLRFVDSNRVMSRVEAVELARSVDLRLHGAPSSDATKLRTTALTELRSHGEAAQALADALTASLPSDYPGVPAYIEAANVDERDCWIVVEVKPSVEDSTTLSGRRYWLLDRVTLDVIESGTLD